MSKDDLVKLTEALGQLGYEIKRFEYIETETKYSLPMKELELTLSLPDAKS